MFKPTKLLRVVSMLFIIFSIIGLVFLGLSFVLLNGVKGMPGIDAATIEAATSTLTMVTGVISGIVGIMAGFFGRSGKSFRNAAIAMGIYSLLTAVSIVQSLMTIPFGITSLVSLILPVLYWWGLYQSK